jgi:hypothetical protein
MDLSAFPDDFFITSSQFTRHTYRDEYPSINPRSPALSQAGKVVIVTGASQGLGRHVSPLPYSPQSAPLAPTVFGTLLTHSQAFAAAFAKASASALVLVARKEKELQETAADIRKINPAIKILTRAIDIRSEEEVKALYTSIKEEFGTVDVLINNAGSGKSALPIKDIDPKDFWYDFVSSAFGETVEGFR